MKVGLSLHRALSKSDITLILPHILPLSFNFVANCWKHPLHLLCTRGTLRRDRWRATRSGNHGVRARTRGVTRDARAHSPPSPPDTKTLIFLLSSIQECARRRDTQNLIRSASWYCYRAENRISRDAACVDQIELRMATYKRHSCRENPSSSFVLVGFPSQRARKTRGIGNCVLPHLVGNTLSSAPLDKFLFYY